MAIKAHLTQTGLKEIISIKAAINKGLPDRLLHAFPDLPLMNKPAFIINKSPLNPFWVSGFTEGEGTFFISFASVNIRSFYQIRLKRTGLPVLVKIQSFFCDIGHIYECESDNTYFYTVNKNLDLYNIIITHFKNYPLIGHKLINFLIWSKIVSLIKSKAHLTSDGMDKIRSLKDQLNK